MSFGKLLHAVVSQPRTTSLVTLLVTVAIPLSGQETRVATLSLQAALLSTQEGQKASADLTAKVEPKRKGFEARQTEISQLESQLRNQGSVLNSQKREELARDLEGRKKRLQRDMQDAEDALEGEQQAMLQRLGQRMLAVIEKYASDNKYSLVLDVGNPSTPVLYTSPSVDITKEVAALFDKTAPDRTAPATPKTPGSSSR